MGGEREAGHRHRRHVHRPRRRGRRAAAAVQELDHARQTRSRACSTSWTWPPPTRRRTPRELLGAAELLIHATTRAINAILTGTTARTALLTTEGHPDDRCVFREGGRTGPFNHRARLPAALRPARADVRGARAHRRRRQRRYAARRGRRASAIVERARGARGSRRSPSACCGRSSTRRTSCASASCCAEHLPGVPFTLSHELNPTMREYRRASSTAHRRLAEAADDGVPRRARERGCASAGFGGRVLMVTSAGGVLDADARRRRRRSTRSTPARRWRRSPAGTTPRCDAGATIADRRRHRRHELRRQPGPPRPHPLDARDLARAALYAAT